MVGSVSGAVVALLGGRRGRWWPTAAYLTKQRIDVLPDLLSPFAGVGDELVSRPTGLASGIGLSELLYKNT